jgi:outer membrane lipoprotein
MIKRSWALIASVLLVTSGCASTDDQVENSPSGAPLVTFLQVKAAPDSYKGQAVTFGGEVLGARRLKEGTRIEILQLPLTSMLQPTLDLSQSQGRFVAMQREFLDPATIPAGTFVTVAGEIAGAVTLPLDETDYNYPIVEIKNLRVWTKPDEGPPRIRPYMGPGPYWGPYWSPFWRPWPYW